MRAGAVRLARATPELLNEIERDHLVEEIMAEAFGLGRSKG